MPKNVPQGSGKFNPFGDLLGLDFSRIDNGYSQCLLEVNENLLNPYGVLHGGVIYSMVDTGMGGALFTRINQDELCATVEINIIYFRFVNAGTLTCNTRLVHKSKRLGFLESEVVGNEGLVAKATGIFSIFKGRSENAALAREG